MKPLLRFLGSLFIVGLLAVGLAWDGVIAPAQAALRQLEEAPGQVVVQSRQTLKDQEGKTWQAIAFRRTTPDGANRFYLRLIGFPGVATLDRSQPLQLTNFRGKTWEATDCSEVMFTDATQNQPSSGQYDLGPILMKLEPAIPLKLSLATMEGPEIVLNIAPEMIAEWRSLQ
ncbi:DUF3122 domain-containing protein [Spirulina sp. CCNP1310]|uniref:DUF3122 domain-containing protein n=1 Tax=Spirulina sp. CCNP1310 TaxID=3110249 RepID=UPI002B20673A|nr:DUF3122 domain-containing protein [Spirulina sp. CCNP1310]MEA5420599.1 DUF3122 domain-containing protein [Spirulina sp. CCNP1310]